MKQYYGEILAAYAETPHWFSENGFPRWVDFHPKHVDDIYADQVLLCRIACQGCGQEFLVAMSSSYFNRHQNLASNLLDEIEPQTLHAGDPPMTKCCAAGPTMNSVMLEVVQCWVREGVYWQRQSLLEIKFNQEDDNGTEGPELRAD